MASRFCIDFDRHDDKHWHVRCGDAVIARMTSKAAAIRFAESAGARVLDVASRRGRRRLVAL